VASGISRRRMLCRHRMVSLVWDLNSRTCPSSSIRGTTTTGTRRVRHEGTGPRTHASRQSRALQLIHESSQKLVAGGLEQACAGGRRAYAASPVDWGCIRCSFSLRPHSITGLGLSPAAQPVSGMVPSLAKVTSERLSTCCVRGLSLSYEDVRYTQISGRLRRRFDILTKNLGESRPKESPLCIESRRAHVANTLTIPGPGVQAGSVGWQFCFR